MRSRPDERRTGGQASVGRVRAITGVRETETLLEMQVHKFTYRDVAGPAGADQANLKP